MSIYDDESLKNPDEISLKDLVRGIKSGIRFVFARWLVVLMFSILFGILGFVYSIIKKPLYTATCTFVLDDGSAKGGGLGQYAGLASLAGINTSGAGGIFQGDNILELYKSRTMIEKTLLCMGDFNGKKEMVIDHYIEFNGLRQRWRDEEGLENISFSGIPEKFNRKQDSLITDIVDFLNKKVLSVDKPDKKLSIIAVSVVSKDELFSQEFTNKLVENVNRFYVQTKTQKAYRNVQILQKQADSVRAVLNGSIKGVASAIDATPNANPTLLTLRVPSQKKQIDVQASSAIYSEVVKNLEVAKMSLLQETPLIQVIDKPVLPLSIEKLGKLKGICIGFFVGGLLTILVILIKRITSK